MVFGFFFLKKNYDYGIKRLQVTLMANVDIMSTREQIRIPTE